MTLRNACLLRYGRSVAYYEWWEQDAAQRQQLVERASRLDRARWHQMRRETTAAQHEQLTRFPSAIGARPILLRSRIAGLLLLRRDFCPHGKKKDSLSQDTAVLRKLQARVTRRHLRRQQRPRR